MTSVRVGLPPCATKFHKGKRQKIVFFSAQFIYKDGMFFRNN